MYFTIQCSSPIPAWTSLDGFLWTWGDYPIRWLIMVNQIYHQPSFSIHANFGVYRQTVNRILSKNQIHTHITVYIWSHGFPLYDIVCIRIPLYNPRLETAVVEITPWHLAPVECRWSRSATLRAFASNSALTRPRGKSPEGLQGLLTIK